MIANKTIRDYAKANRIAHWRIAEELGIHEAVLCRNLRHELPKKEQDKIMAIISDLIQRDRQELTEGEEE